MRGRWTVALTVVAGLAVAAMMCRTGSNGPPRDIVVEGNALTVVNNSAAVWDNVEIWLNDHYHVTRSRMLPGERFSVPLNAFVAGFGQRFVPGRQVVKGIEVTGMAAGGTPVRLTWGEGRRR